MQPPSESVFFKFHSAILYIWFEGLQPVNTIKVCWAGQLTDPHCSLTGLDLLSG